MYQLDIITKHWLTQLCRMPVDLPSNSCSFKNKSSPCIGTKCCGFTIWSISSCRNVFYFSLESHRMQDRGIRKLHLVHEMETASVDNKRLIRSHPWDLEFNYRLIYMQLIVLKVIIKWKREKRSKSETQENLTMSPSLSNPIIDMTITWL